MRTSAVLQSSVGKERNHPIIHRTNTVIEQPSVSLDFMIPKVVLYFSIQPSYNLNVNMK